MPDPSTVPDPNSIPDLGGNSIIHRILLKVSDREFACRMIICKPSGTPAYTAEEIMSMIRTKYLRDILCFINQGGSLPEGVQEMTSIWETKIKFNTTIGPPPETPKGEADKPAGSRDVDKFLKEQQDKLWKEMM